MKPDIYYFNPTCELAVANGSPNFMAPANLRLFEHELSTLPGILAQPKDLVLVDRKIIQSYKDQLESAGFRLPSYRTSEDLLADPAFIATEIGFLCPWGWSPSAHKQLMPFKSGCSPAFQKSPVAAWREIHREGYSRKSSLAILTQIISNQIISNTLTFNELPEICTSQEQIVALQRKWEKVVVKAPWSASGRGLLVLRNNEYNQSNKQIISGFLKQQGYVVAGPWHEKLLDLSFQFFSTGNGRIEYRGLTSFTTDHLGRYVGNFLQELPPNLAPEISLFLKQNIPEIKNALQVELIKSDYSTDYYGWIGVDALVWKTTAGKLKFHPCLEINSRFTMGAIALKLREHLSEYSAGEFRIMHGQAGEFLQFCLEMTKKEALIVDNGKIVQGFLPLTPPLPDSSFGAWISVSRK